MIPWLCEHFRFKAPRSQTFAGNIHSTCGIEALHLTGSSAHTTFELALHGRVCNRGVEGQPGVLAVAEICC